MRILLKFHSQMNLRKKRPFNSRLSKDKLVENGFKPLPDWKDAVKRYLETI